MCISLLITLLYNPYNIRNISVLLSYGGVIGIVFYQKNISQGLNKIIKRKGKIINYIKGIISVSLSVQTIIIPIMAYYYKTISITFLISNILSRFFNKYYNYFWVYFNYIFFYIFLICQILGDSV